MGTGSFFKIKGSESYFINKNDSDPFILIGPTASGKTDVSLILAKELNTEIISADPMLVYKDFNIGTAKPSLYELKSVKHHLIDIINPDEIFNAADFAKEAKKIIDSLLSKGKTPIIVSGTGFYIRTLVNGIFPAPKPDWDLRKNLEKEAEIYGNEFVHKKLLKIDPETGNKLHTNDLRRIIRAIEIYELTGKPISLLKKFKSDKEFNYIIFGLYRTRMDLYKRVNKRVDDMMKNGLLEEVKLLLSKYGKDAFAFKGLGYKELVEFLVNSPNSSLEETINKIKVNTRRYVKRQFTWFKKEPNIIWIDTRENDTPEYIAEKIMEHLR